MLHIIVVLMESPVPHYCQMNTLWLQFEGLIDDLTEVTGLYEENVSPKYVGPKLIKILCKIFKPDPTANLAATVAISRTLLCEEVSEHITQQPGYSQTMHGSTEDITVPEDLGIKQDL